MCNDILGCWNNAKKWWKLVVPVFWPPIYDYQTTNHLYSHNHLWHNCCKKSETRWRLSENLLSQTLGVGRPVSSPCHRTSAYHFPDLYMRGACRKKEEEGEGEGRNEKKEIHLSVCLTVDHTITAHTCPFLTEVPVIISCSSGLNTQSVLQREDKPIWKKQQTHVKW